MYGEQLGMSKQKKIFHKPQEEIPSADDILNYLNEDSSPVPPPKKKSSPSGGSKNRSKKTEKDESSIDDLLAKKDEETEEVMRSAPAPSMEISVKLEGFLGGEDKKQNKKKYELEKAMLSEPLVSDAVEGYALLGDRKKAKILIDEINQTIAGQTGKKNNRAVVMRIAAIILVVFMISGGSLYLFDQMSGDKMTAVSNEKTSPVSGILSDTVSEANKNELKSDPVKSDKLAIEREEINEPFGELKPTNSDGYLSTKKETAGPTDEEAPKSNGMGISTETLSSRNESEKKEEIKDLPKMNAPVERSIAADSVSKEELDALSYMDDLDEIKKADKTSDQIQRNTERSREPSKNKKAKSKGKADSYAPAVKSQSESLDQEIASGTTRRGYLLEDGIRLYNQGKYTEAKEIFQGVLASQPSNQEAIFYSGMSDYKMKLYDPALTSLSKVIPASRRFDEARWYISMIYIDTNRKEEAIMIWKELSKTSNSYSEKAFEKLKKYSK